MTASKQRAEELAKTLGEGWTAGKQGKADGLVLDHGPTRLSFVAVPGGTFDMGLTDADIEAVKVTLGWSPEIAEIVAAARAAAQPVRSVDVAPFLVSRATLSRQEVERLSDGKHHGKYCHTILRAEARELARSLGFRLPSEAELQWLARDGGRTHFVLDAAARLEEADGDSDEIPSRFGLADMFLQQWAEDDWHPSFDGAPRDASPWMGGDACGVGTGWTMPEYVDEPHQAIGLLAALRTSRDHKKAAVRLALDLPR